MIICKIQSQYSLKVNFAQHDYVVQAFPADGANDSFSEGILPGRSRRSEDFVDSHTFDAVLEIVAVDAIAIAKEKTWGFLVTVSGCTMASADRQLDHSRDSHTQKTRSRGRSLGRLQWCLKTASCWRRARFSIARLALGTSIARTSRNQTFRTPICAPE